MFKKLKDSLGKFVKIKDVNDIVGKKINNWKVLSFEEYDKDKKLYYYWCKCTCGSVHKKHRQSLTKCTTRSCAVCRYIVTKMARKNRTDNPSYNSWRGMRSRCNNPNRPDWKYYGGRGITYCNRWKSFDNFLDDMGERLPGTSLDRINTNGNYDPSNCRWATSKQQNRNTNHNAYYGFNGKSLTMSEWSEFLGIKYPTLVGFLKKDKTRTIKDAVKYFYMDDKYRNDYTYSGKYFHTVDGEKRSFPWIAKSLGVNVVAFRSFAKKFGVEKAIEYYKLNKEDKRKYLLRLQYPTYKYNGEVKTRKEWCEYLKADRHSFYKVVDNLGFDKAMEIYDIKDKTMPKKEILKERVRRVKKAYKETSK